MSRTCCPPKSRRDCPWLARSCARAGMQGRSSVTIPGRLEEEEEGGDHSEILPSCCPGCRPDFSPASILILLKSTREELQRFLFDLRSRYSSLSAFVVDVLVTSRPALATQRSHSSSHSQRPSKAIAPGRITFKRERFEEGFSRGSGNCRKVSRHLRP